MRGLAGVPDPCQMPSKRHHVGQGLGLVGGLASSLGGFGHPLCDHAIPLRTGVLVTHRTGE